MAGEPNQIFWRGIRPTDPPENIPVDIKVITATMPVQITSITGNMPVDVKVHTVNTPVDVKSHAVNTPVDIKAHTVQTPVVLKSSDITLPVGIAAVTGNLPIDVKAHTVNTPVDIKSHDVDTPVKDSWVLQGSDNASVSNPTSLTIHLDSGQLTAGYYDFKMLLNTSVTHRFFTIKHRNAANDNSLHSFYLMSGAYAPYNLDLRNWYFGANERMTVTQYGNMTGDLKFGMLWVKRA